MRLVLVGIGVNAVMSALIGWMLTRTSVETASVATRWLAGSVSGVTLGDCLVLLPLVVLVTIAVVRLGPDLGALRLGRDVAASIGVRPGRTELVALGLAILAAGAATAVAGPVGFVAFVAPQVALRVFGTAGPTPVLAGLTGALLVLGADRAAQLTPTMLPVGVVTAAVGAPVLMYLLTRRTRSTSV